MLWFFLEWLQVTLEDLKLEASWKEFKQCLAVWVRCEEQSLSPLIHVMHLKKTVFSQTGCASMCISTLCNRSLQRCVQPSSARPLCRHTHTQPDKWRPGIVVGAANRGGSFMQRSSHSRSADAATVAALFLKLLRIGSQSPRAPHDKVHTISWSGSWSFCCPISISGSSSSWRETTG